MEKLRNVARFGKYGKRLCMMFLFLCITTSGLMRASVFAQTTVTAKFRNVTLNEVLWEIRTLPLSTAQMMQRKSEWKIWM